MGYRQATMGCNGLNLKKRVIPFTYLNLNRVVPKAVKKMGLTRKELTKYSFFSSDLMFYP